MFTWLHTIQMLKNCIISPLLCACTHVQPQVLMYLSQLLHLPLSNLHLTPGKPHEEYQKAPWVSLSGLSFHSKSLYHPPFTIWLGAMLIFHHSTPWATACQTTIKQQYEYPTCCTNTWPWPLPVPFHCFLHPPPLSWI